MKEPKQPPCRQCGKRIEADCESAIYCKTCLQSKGRRSLRRFIAALRRQALAKLTDAEIKALGIEEGGGREL